MMWFLWSQGRRSQKFTGLQVKVGAGEETCHLGDLGLNQEGNIYIPFLCLLRFNWIYAMCPSSGSHISKPPLQLGMATWSCFRPYKVSTALGSHFLWRRWLLSFSLIPLPLDETGTASWNAELGATVGWSGSQGTWRASCACSLSALHSVRSSW